MNWYKKAQTWDDYATYKREYGFTTEEMPPEERPYLRQKNIIYQLLRRDKNLRYEEIIEVIDARHAMGKNSKTTNPKYFVEWVKSHPDAYPNISQFNTKSLVDIWDTISSIHYMELYDIRRNVENQLMQEVKQMDEKRKKWNIEQSKAKELPEEMSMKEQYRAV